uniref:Aminopeptidase n=1 Tax=Daphnia magna TaxID=35525 RepID=A0A0P5FVD5_9CRUS
MSAVLRLTVTKCRASGIVVILIACLMAVGLSVYFLAGRPYPTANSCSVSPKRPSLPSFGAAPKIAQSVIRLPRTVLPHHYDVRLLPILEKGNFTVLGRVAIDLQCVEETDRIVLHSSDIKVDLKSVQVIEQGEMAKNMLSVESIDYETVTEFLIIRLNAKHKVKLAKRTNYTLSMDFVGNLTDTSAGFFRSVYVEDGVERYMAVSQMEPTDARRVFPCFDEPNMKAIFTVSIGRHRDMTALSNMPLIDTTAIDGMQDFYWDHFAPTLLMSTYLVAFVVANFTKIEADVGNSNWKFNIHVRTSAVSQAQYAKVIGPKAQAFYEDYFQMPFPLPKQDMIAIPSAFVGAMENWGLLTYGESVLLYDADVSSLDDRQTVVELVTHELAHQWFGNLVTMDWWSDLWLKEGFTSYIECLAAEHVDPSLERLEQFVTSALHTVMRLDALESSHPISVLVNHPDEIGELFDDISYKKGAAITRMLANFIGAKSFRNGLTHYLRIHQYGNAVQDDLWNALDRQADLDQVFLPTNVKTIMDTWTLKMGFPVVTVQRDYSSQNVTITQKRFLVRKSNSTTADPTVYLWWTPLTYTTDFRTIGSTWLAENQSSKNLTLEFEIRDDEWVIFNVNETGYYRVNYDARNWHLIAKQLMTNHTAISVINRAQIMNDALNLARAGLLVYEVPLNLTKYLEREEEFLPWEATLTALSYLDSMMKRTPGYGLLKNYVLKILSPLYDSLGFVNRSSDSHLTGKLRRKVVESCCSMGHKDCITKAIDSYHRWMSDPQNTTIVPAMLKRVVACTAIRHGGEVEWDFAFQRFRDSNVASEKATLLSSLSCTQESWIIARMLEMCLNPTTGFRTQDALDVIKTLAGNPIGRFLTFNFTREKWLEMTKIFSSIHNLAHVFESVTKAFNTDMELKELSDFVGRNKELLVSAMTRSTQQSIDRVRSNLSWMKQNYRHVVNWLQKANTDVTFQPST